jgi:flagellar hook protein FlgE
MNIAFNAGTQGMRAAITQQDITANNIVNVNTWGFRESEGVLTEENPTGVRVANIVKRQNPNLNASGTRLEEQMPKMIINKNTMAANAKVVKIQDKMIGEVIDLIA